MKTVAQCRQEISALLSRYGLTLISIAGNREIPGSFWKDDEAGLIENRLYVHDSTPVHSALHEACHYVCMTADRRRMLHTNAGGDYDEENAVCYLQILLADEIDDYSASQTMREMDHWGYSFRLGSASRWFEEDAGDALENLKQWQLITCSGKPAYTLRVN